MHVALSEYFIRFCFNLYHSSRLAQTNPLPYEDTKLVENMKAYDVERNRVHIEEATRRIRQLPPWARAAFGMR